MKKRDVKRVIDALIEWSDEIMFTYQIGVTVKGAPEVLYSEAQVLDWLRDKKTNGIFLECLTEDAK